jgi:hypothetical protein
MELQNFVAETLKQVAAGIKDAQAADTGAWICPPLGSNESGKAVERESVAVQFVQFDVAVTVEDQSSVQAGGRIKVLSFAMGAEGTDASKNSQISRIRFQIPVRWPVVLDAPQGHLKHVPMGKVYIAPRDGMWDDEN